MFYSQFILAKKGPLGTIWVAAHLERKLRKNQIADTDIGISVDSILSPDVPIALRLSSHLLLGVVRIYSRKVNYLFDDCSEALLKIKQAFRSAAVDLPPEESKAPYHSITMPETFDLDDFELPENDIVQGNFVDHHISSREQITLQDTIEGVSYSTSKFGLDERFGDGGACELDLDEEFLLENAQTTESANPGDDPGITIAILKLDDLSETTAVNSGSMAPSTPGLVEEPNLSESKIHMESEHHLVESSMMDNAKEIVNVDKHEAKWFPHVSFDDDVIPDLRCKKDDPSDFKSITDPFGEDDTLIQVSEACITEDIERKDFDEVRNYCKDHVLLDMHEEDSSRTTFLKPCNSTTKSHDISIPESGMYPDIYVQFDAAVLESSGVAENSKLGEVVHASEIANTQMRESHRQETPSVEDALEQTELHEPEKLMSAPDVNLDENKPALLDGSPGELVGLTEDTDGIKIISGKKRSFTESTLTEKSLNSAESSRLVRFKQTVDSVPADDDLLSSILVGRSSALKVKPTPRLSEVTSVKRTQSAPRTGAPKRKILMDEMMVLHGDMIRQQLLDTEDIRRVRKKAPCSRPEVSMIHKQHSEDELFLDPMFSGISNDLISLQHQIHDLTRITVCKSDQDGSSFEIMANNDQKTIESLNIENDSCASPRMTTEVLLGGNSEAAETGKDSVYNSNDIHAVELNADAYIIDEQTGMTNIEELLLNETGPEIILRKNDDENSSFAAEKNEMKVSFDTVPSTITSEGMVEGSFELESSPMEAVTEQRTIVGELERTDINVNVSTEPEDVLPPVDPDFVADLLTNEHRELDYNYNVHSEIDNDFLGKSATFLHPEDGFNDTVGNQELGSYVYNMVGAEDSVQYHPDQDAPEYSPTGIDTGFLNLDDEDDDEKNEAEVDDNPPPVDQDTQFAEKTGWSSRTRAVSKYLHTLFIKEAEFGRESLSMANLLTGKSRKEASRMFFEALVLKTRDYIDLEQENPCGDTTIRAKPKLMKSNS